MIRQRWTIGLGLGILLAIGAAAEASSLEVQVLEQNQNLILANEEARHSAAILKSTFNTIAEAVLVTDRSGAIVLSDPAAVRIFQLKPATTLVDLKNQNRMRAALDAPIGVPMTTPQV